MGNATTRKTARPVGGAAWLFAATLLLAGCGNPGVSQFTTNQDVALRFSQADDSTITARLPRGTPVERLGWVGAECECWLVTSANGTGWVYTRYLDMHMADSPLQE
jgi:hypothetical protein